MKWVNRKVVTTCADVIRDITVPKDAPGRMLGSNGALSCDYDQGQRLLKVKPRIFLPCKDYYCFKITGAQLRPEAPK